MSQLKLKGILSYPNLTTPRAVTPGDDPKYSASLLIAKNDPQVAVIQAAIEAMKLEGFPSGFPANGNICLKDCATASPEDPSIAQYMALSANSTAAQKPMVVDPNMQPVMDPAAFAAGDIVWMSVNLFSYNKPVNKGIGCGLNGVMLTGELGALGRLDGRPTVEQMFGDIAGGVAPPVAPVAAPVVTAPAAPVGAPVAAPPAAPVAAPHVMTAAATGTYEAYQAAGWTDEQLIAGGLMINPSFV